MVVFDEAHNIDNTCIDSMSVKINRKLLDKCQNSITVLEEEIQRLKSEDSSRLREEYDKLVAGKYFLKINFGKNFKMSKFIFLTFPAYF